MNTKMILLIIGTAFATVLFAGTAIAGEWNQKGDVAAKEQGRSECLFNGLDEPDESSLGAGDGEGPAEEGNAESYDDFLWSVLTPAGKNSGGTVRVQTGGQLIAAGLAPPGVQGEACNGNLIPINAD
jgi:hypothetical protein